MAFQKECTEQRKNVVAVCGPMYSTGAGMRKDYSGNAAVLFRSLLPCISVSATWNSTVSYANS